MDNNQEKFELEATQLSFAQTCSASAGWKWLNEGFTIFKKSPGLWMLILLMTIVIGGICKVIPMLGELLSLLISPVLMGGIMMVAHRFYMEFDAEFDDLFSGFRYRLWPLIQVALLYLAGLCGAIIIAIGIGITFLGAEIMQSTGDALMTMTQLSSSTLAKTPDLDPIMMGQFMVMAMLILVVMLPIMMMYYFAPVLVMFHGVDAFSAMKLSFMACCKNAIPFLVYGLLIMVFCVLSVFTLFLGLLVLIPVIWASTYVAYRDIFLSEKEELAA